MVILFGHGINIVVKNDENLICEKEDTLKRGYMELE